MPKTQTVEMHLHMYQISTSLIVSPPKSAQKVVHLKEHSTNLNYEPQTFSLPIVSSTIYMIPNQSFRIQCKREGDAKEAGIQDLSFEVFVDGVWITGTSFKLLSPHPRTVYDLLI